MAQVKVALVPPLDLSLSMKISPYPKNRSFSPSILKSPRRVAEILPMSPARSLSGQRMDKQFIRHGRGLVAPRLELPNDRVPARKRLQIQTPSLSLYINACKPLKN